jgi:hypothetical protein
VLAGPPPVRARGGVAYCGGANNELAGMKGGARALVSGVANRATAGDSNGNNVAEVANKDLGVEVEVETVELPAELGESRSLTLVDFNADCPGGRRPWDPAGGGVVTGSCAMEREWVTVVAKEEEEEEEGGRYDAPEEKADNDPSSVDEAGDAKTGAEALRCIFAAEVGVVVVVVVVGRTPTYSGGTSNDRCKNIHTTTIIHQRHTGPALTDTHTHTYTHTHAHACTHQPNTTHTSFDKGFKKLLVEE